jgi:hypothetical protein
MSSPPTNLTRFLIPAASLLGVLSLGGGLYGVLNPVAWSSTMGVEISAASSPAAVPYASFTAARNIAGGLTLLGLVQQRQYRAVGIYLLAGTSTALLDAWICKGSEAAVEGKALGHAVMGGVVGLLGGAVLYCC